MCSRRSVPWMRCGAPIAATWSAVVFTGLEPAPRGSKGGDPPSAVPPAAVATSAAVAARAAASPRLAKRRCPGYFGRRSAVICESFPGRVWARRTEAHLESGTATAVRPYHDIGRISKPGRARPHRRILTSAESRQTNNATARRTTTPCRAKEAAQTTAVPLLHLVLSERVAGAAPDARSFLEQA